MDQIAVEQLVKTYRVALRKPGLVNAIRGIASRGYQTVRALDGVSFSIGAGELVGYIGPNGAGKSTTIKILSGILVPDSGSCRVLGHVPWRERAAYVGKIGVVFGQRPQLWWDLPVMDSFDLLRDIYRIEPGQYRRDRDQLVEELGLAGLLDVPVRQLSLGQRMRCDLVASLLHAPALLFLDEPTIGLDATSKLALRGFIRQLNRQRGVTVLLTTHDMEEISALAERVMVIGTGSILFDGKLKALLDSIMPQRRLVLTPGANQTTTDLQLPPGAQLVARERERVEIAFDPRLLTAARLIEHVSGRISFTDLLVVNPPVDEIISRLYGELEP